MNKTMTRIEALKAFFTRNGGRALENKEIAELLKADRPGFGELCQEAAKELGVELTKTPAKAAA